MEIGQRFAEECRKLTPVERIAVAEDATRTESQFTWLAWTGTEFSLTDSEGRALPLPLEHLEAVMQRYALPLGDVGDVRAFLRVPPTGVLARMLYVPEFDVEPKDYLVWAPTSGETLVALCAHLVPPLLHLARAEKRRRSS